MRLSPRTAYVAKSRRDQGARWGSVFPLSMLAIVVVLLLVAIATFPMFSSVWVDPPQFQTGSLVDRNLEARVILIDHYGQTFFGATAVRDEQHLTKLMESMPTGTRLRLEADRAVSMERITEVFRAAQRAGITEIEVVRGVAVEDIRPFQTE